MLCREWCVLCVTGEGESYMRGTGGSSSGYRGGGRGPFTATCRTFSFLLCSSATVSEKFDFIILTRSLYVYEPGGGRHA